MKNNSPNNKFTGINRKFLILVSIFSVIGFLIISLIGYLTYQKKVNDDARDIVKIKAEKIQRIISGKIEKWKSEIQLLAISDKASSMDTEGIVKYLKKKKQFLPDYLFFHVTDTLGNYTTTDGLKNSNSNRDYFKRAIAGELNVSDPIISRTTGKPIIIIACPVRNSLGKVIGIISGAIELDQITRIINSEKIDQTGYAVMINKKGLVMAYPEHDSLLKFSLLSLKDEGTQRIVRDMISGGSGVNQYYFKGEKKVAAYLPVETNGWSIAATISYDEVYASVIALRNEMLIAAVTGTVMMCLLILSFLRKHILSPIRKLEKAAKIISEGDLQHKIEVTSDDEFGRLSIAFNKMTQKLHDDDLLRKNMENTLRERENLLELFFSQSLDGFYIMKLDEPVCWNDSANKEELIEYVVRHERVVKVNDAMLAQYATTREQFLGLTPYELYPHDIEEAKQGWANLMNNRRSHVETDERKFDGTKMRVEGDYICIYDDLGRNIGHFGIQRDITERKLIQEDLIRAKEKAELSNKLKSEFLAQMSHEIRTPINTILSFNSLLSMELEGKIPEELQDGFKIVNMGGRRLIRTIDLILNMSEIQTGSYEANIVELDLDKDIFCNLLPEFKMAANTKNLDLCYKNYSDSSVIRADNYTVMQIFVNLVDNAIKFTPSGSVEISLETYESSNLMVKVSDTGIGISEEYLPNLFEPFSQEDSGYTRRFEGNGLGLALVKKYCELNNADIFVESHKGKGTTFSVIFNK